MDSIIKEALNFSKFTKIRGGGSGGCISSGNMYESDCGKLYVKENEKEKAYQMFHGEFEGIKALNQTKLVKVPDAIKVINNPQGGAVLVLEYVEMASLRHNAAVLGKQIAQLHLHNDKIVKNQQVNEKYISSVDEESDVKYISQFGFHTPTSCGYLLQNNEWCDDWVSFYSRKLQDQINMIEKEYGDREATKLWSMLSRKMVDFFKNLEIKPSLLHGDLWSGNAAVDVASGETVIFDPACFYGHHEYDLAISGMFGGFGPSFWNEYHKVIPKENGWDERHKLYTLFHQLNHWNHFGSGYRSESLSAMRELCM